MDLVVWGHEHECDIELTESVVGTFRISQPGSSVATSLVEGESVRKKVAVLHLGEKVKVVPIPAKLGLGRGEWLALGGVLIPRPLKRAYALCALPDSSII